MRLRKSWVLTLSLSNYDMLGGTIINTRMAEESAIDPRDPKAETHGSKPMEGQPSRDVSVPSKIAAVDPFG